eukprot:gene28421-32104_t
MDNVPHDEERKEDQVNVLQSYGSPQTLEGHWSIVRSAIELKGAYTGLICSTSNDKTIRIWLDPSKKEKHFHPEQILRGHLKSITTAVQLADDRICTGSDDGLLKIWDPTKNWTTGQCDKTMRGHTDAVNVIILLRDKKRLCSGSVDRTLMIWDLELLRSTHILRGHEGPIHSIVETRDARQANASPSRARGVLSRSEKPGILSEEHQSTRKEAPTLTVASLLINGSRKNPIFRVEDGFHIESTLLTRGHKAPVYSVIQLTDGRACSASAD